MRNVQGKEGRAGRCSEMAQYPGKTGYYDQKELHQLSTCLGFPGGFLIDGLQSAHFAIELNKPVSDCVLRKLLESRHLEHKLEKVFNHYPAHHNRKLFLKAMSLLRHKRLNFSEISMARVAFELYRSEDHAGMLASASVVLTALNMLGRVMSPVQLETEIQKQQNTADFPSRIQMYEFMDLVTKCAHSKSVEREVEALTSVQSPMSTIECTESGGLLPLPNLDWLLLAKEEHICAHLDEQYRKSLYKKVKATPPSSNTDGVLLASRVYREESTANSRRQLHTLAPVLAQSQHQLFKARNGFAVLSKEQLQAAESLHTSRQSSRAGARSKLASRGGDTRLTDAGSRMSKKSSMSSRAGTRSNWVLDTSSEHPAGSRANMGSGHQYSPGHVSSLSRGDNYVTEFHDRLAQLPQSVTKEACSVEYLPKSKSVPVLPSLHQKSCKEEMTVEDLSEETSKKARTKSKMLSSTSAFQFSKLGEKESRSYCEDVGRVVSEQDIQHHRGLIDELKWEELRRKWQQQPNKLQCSSRIRHTTL